MIDPVLGELYDFFEGKYPNKPLWQVEVQTRVFKELLLVQFEGKKEQGLTPELKQALDLFLEHQEQYKQLALERLLFDYQTMIVPYFRESEDVVDQGLAPNVQNVAELEGLLRLPVLTLHNANSWGLEFECTWDEDHGAGVFFENGQVTRAGDGASAQM